MFLLLLGCAPATFGPDIDPDLPRREALVVLDMQVDFLDPEGAMPADPAQASLTLETVQWMLDEVPDPYVVTNVFSEQARVANAFRGGAAVEGSAGAALWPELELPEDASLWTKDQPDAFSDPDFEQALLDDEVTDLVLVGVMADGCVMATAKGALRRGYGVSVVEDGVATMSDARLERAYARYERLGVGTLHVDEALDDLAAYR